ncbi:hypothetical protein HPB50_003450 [Hyalomma asiaticum]|uniref:Uncharacterized protein n=1 Tax=Hyalomma asiaticum TaxID=266040 RepID=A0ACB7SPS4_HYAAI|nr:hypothetical protein HPB50_003450 [Hyalomma asiaticum]
MDSGHSAYTFPPGSWRSDDSLAKVATRLRSLHRRRRKRRHAGSPESPTAECLVRATANPYEEATRVLEALFAPKEDVVLTSLRFRRWTQRPGETTKAIDLAKEEERMERALQLFRGVQVDAVSPQRMPQYFGRAAGAQAGVVFP